jgi:hypothetical protein
VFCLGEVSVSRYQCKGIASMGLVSARSTACGVVLEARPACLRCQAIRPPRSGLAVLEGYLRFRTGAALARGFSGGASPRAPNCCDSACAHAAWFLLGMRGMVALTCCLNRVVAHALHAVECMLGATAGALRATTG